MIESPSDAENRGNYDLGHSFGTDRRRIYRKAEPVTGALGRNPGLVDTGKASKNTSLEAGRQGQTQLGTTFLARAFELAGTDNGLLYGIPFKPANDPFDRA